MTVVTLQGGPAAGQRVAIEDDLVVLKMPMRLTPTGAILASEVEAVAMYTDEGLFLGLEFLPQLVALVLPPDWETRHSIQAEEPST